MFLRLNTLAALALGLLLARPGPVRAQLSSEELKTYYKLLDEPDGKEAFAKRLKLFAEALERYGDPKRRLDTTYGISMKRARIPAAEGVPFLLKFVEHKAEAVKRTAMSLLGEYGPDGGPAVPRLRQLMDDENRNVRCDAMLTLSQIVPADREIAAAILERLGADKSDDTTNRAVIQALIRMAAVVPKSAVPRLVTFREHKWTEVCMLAHEAAGKVLALERPTLDQLRTLESIDWRNTPDQGYSVLAAIQEAGAKADFAVPLLVELLSSDPPAYLQCVALDALGKTSTGHPRIISFLVDRLVASDLLLRWKARQALVKVDLREAPAVRALAKGLRHPDSSVRFEAASILRSWDQQSKLTPAGLAELFPPLIDTLREWNEDVHPGNLDVYLHLLKHFGPKAAPVAETVVRAHTSPTYFQKLEPRAAALYRAKLLAVLANIGVPDTARPLIWDALKSGPAELDDGFAYAAAARAVADFGPDARQAIPWLLPALKPRGKEEARVYFIDWSSKVGYPFTTARVEAIRTLAKFGPDAKEALLPLKEIAAAKPAGFGTTELQAQQEARRAIAAIEGRLEGRQ